MKKIFLVLIVPLSGCYGIMVTDGVAKNSSTAQLCGWADRSIYDYARAAAYKELEKRKIVCPTSPSVASTGIRFEPTAQSLQMMQMGAELLMNSQPKQIYIPPPPAPVRCQSWPIGRGGYQTTCQ